MSLAAFASVVIVAVVSLAQPAATAPPDLRDLRWVRAAVVSTSPDSITLNLRDRQLTLLRDAATEVVATDAAAALAPGAIVEAHYTDRKNVRRAVVLIADTGIGELSKRPKTSARGTMLQVKRSALSINSGGKTRGGLAFEKKSRLVDRDGRLLATGKDAIAKLLAVDSDVLVKYDTSGGVIVEGVDLGGSDNIVEIRLLR